MIIISFFSDFFFFLSITFTIFIFIFFFKKKIKNKNKKNYDKRRYNIFNCKEIPFDFIVIDIIYLYTSLLENSLTQKNMY